MEGFNTIEHFQVSKREYYHKAITIMILCEGLQPMEILEIEIDPWFT